MTTNNQIQWAWKSRDKNKTNDDNILRIANAFNLTENEVKKILNKYVA